MAPTCKQCGEVCSSRELESWASAAEIRRDSRRPGLQKNFSTRINYWLTRTLYAVDVGVADTPEILQTRTVTVVVEETHAFQVKPVPGSTVGLTATAMEGDKPVMLAFPDMHAPAATELPPMLEVVPESGNWLVSAMVPLVS